MGRMMNLAARYSFVPPKSTAEYCDKTPAYTFDDKMPSFTVTAVTPPVSIKSAKSRSVTPANSVESSPKTSFDEEAPRPITCTRIDFASETLPEYSDMYAIQIDNVFSREECEEMLSSAEASNGGQWDRPRTNDDNQTTYNETRKCGRIIWDSQAAIDKVWDRISDLPELQEIQRLEHNAHVTGNGPARKNEVWELSRPNDKLRFLKYEEGDFFRPHCDGSFETPDRQERSYYTMQMYLNDSGPPSPQALRSLPREQRKAAQKNYLMGGNTTFNSYDGQRQFVVTPKAGSVLIFQHRNLLHSGTDVLKGTKTILRTDLMYRKA